MYVYYDGIMMYYTSSSCRWTRLCMCTMTESWCIIPPRHVAGHVYVCVLWRNRDVLYTSSCSWACLCMCTMTESWCIIPPRLVAGHVYVCALWRNRDALYLLVMLLDTFMYVHYDGIVMYYTSSSCSWTRLCMCTMTESWCIVHPRHVAGHVYVCALWRNRDVLYLLVM